MGWSSRSKRDKEPGGTEGGGPSGFGKATLFTDVHPQHRINARFFIQMFEMLSQTTLSPDEQQRVMHRSLLLVVNKLATTWRHLTRYQGIEKGLLESARKKPLQRVEPVSHDPGLYRACDDFMIQLRDGLNRLLRFPADILPDWPLTGMPESVDAAFAALAKMTDERVQPIVEALENHRPWIEEVLSQTTKGLDPLVFQVFVAGPESGDPREAVPMWTQTESASATMRALWESFYVLSELVVGASIAFRLRPGAGLMYRFQPLSSDESSWILMKPEPRLVMQPGDLSAMREALTLAQSGQPMLQAVFKGKRFRVVGNTLIARPPAETFHEFLWGLLRNTLGEQWWKAEHERAEAERHQIIRWFDALVRWKQEGCREENKTEEGWRAAPSGDVQALIALSYDIYTLRHAGTLPAKLVTRLGDRVGFQGAKYEIAVAAMFRRAGFKLEFLEGSGKHCEFIALHPTGLRLGVEAKSRRRPGVLHEKGTLDELTAVRGDVQALFDDAKQQKPPGLPFLIFIDLNAPLGSTATPIDAPWLKDLNVCLDTHETTRGGRPDPFNALVVTNFSAHYVGAALIESKGEALLIKAKRPADRLPEATLLEVWAAVGRYGSPPEDLERFEQKEPDPAGGESAGQ